MADSQPKNRALIKAPSTEVAKSRSALAERGVGSVQIAVFSEEDVRASKSVTDKSRFQQVVTQLQDTDDTSGAPEK